MDVIEGGGTMAATAGTEEEEEEGDDETDKPSPSDMAERNEREKAASMRAGSKGSGFRGSGRFRNVSNPKCQLAPSRQAATRCQLKDSTGPSRRSLGFARHSEKEKKKTRDPFARKTVT